MKKMLILLAIVILIQPSMVLADKIDDAGKYLLIGEPTDAEVLIKKVFNEDPFNVNKHIRVGKIYWENGYTLKAYNHFFKANKLEPKKIGEISQFYLDKAEQLISQGKYRKSLEPYQKVFLLNPSLKAKTIEDIYCRGVSLLRQGMAGTSYDFFNVAQSNDNRYRAKIADVYFQLGNQSSFGPMLNFYKTALSFSSALKDRVEAQVIAKLSSGEVGKAEKKAAKPQVKKLVSSENFKLLYPPDYKIYQPRSEPYVFNLKAGEITDHWIMFPAGRITKYFPKSPTWKFILLYSDGTSYDVWEIDKFPKKNNPKFKIKAIDSQPITMTVN